MAMSFTPFWLKKPFFTPRLRNSDGKNIMAVQTVDEAIAHLKKDDALPNGRYIITGTPVVCVKRGKTVTKTKRTRAEYVLACPHAKINWKAKVMITQTGKHCDRSTNVTLREFYNVCLGLGKKSLYVGNHPTGHYEFFDKKKAN